MTSQTRSRFGLCALAIAMMVGAAVVGSASTMGQQTAMMTDGNRMDIPAMMSTTDVGNMPVHNITEAF